MKKIFPLIMLTAQLCSCGTDRTSSFEPPIRLLLGSYSSADAEGIRLYDFDQNTGQFSFRCGLKGIANPSYLRRVGDSIFLSVSETDDGNDALHLFQIAEDAEDIGMKILSSQPTNGKAPCYVNFHPATSQAFTANYNGGSLSTFGIDPVSGLLTKTGQSIQMSQPVFVLLQFCSPSVIG